MHHSPGRALRVAGAVAACFAVSPPVALAQAAPLPAGSASHEPLPPRIADGPPTLPMAAQPLPGTGLAQASQLGAGAGAGVGPGVRAPAAQDAEDVADLRRRLEAQAARIEQLTQAVDAQQQQLQSLRQQLGGLALDQVRGAGGPGAGEAPGSVAAPAVGVPGRVPGPMAQATGSPQAPAASSGQQQQPGRATPQQQQQQAQQQAQQQPAQIFEQPGVLTPRGRFILEPSLQLGYSSSSRLSVVGYTVIPALNVGLFDVREVKRTTLIGTLSGRYGLTNRLEIEARLPYVYRNDDTISRPFGLGAGQDSLFSASGRDIGDIELAVRYQLNQPTSPNKPYYIGSLRFKSRTGTDPFEVLSDPSLPGTPGAAAGTAGLQRELPTGSGFYALQPALTWLLPSDPFVLFGSVSYLYNFARSDVVRNTTNGPERLGEIKPGDIIGFNFGLGLSLNDKASLSLGYDHASVGRSKQNGATAPLSVRTQLGTLLLGLSYRLDAKRSIGVSLGVGATRDAPDMTLTVRMPYSF